MNAAMAVLFVGSMFLAACIQGGPQGEQTSDSPSPRRPPSGPFEVSSPAFGEAAAIPPRHTCDAEETSPPLRFANAPLDASHVALIMEDPDAPTRTVLHWTFWNLPADRENLSEDADLPSLGAREGQEYRGPCPPVGTHRYFFYAYATEGPLELPEDADVDELRAALEGRVRASDEMYGTYTRPNLPVFA